LLSLPLQVFKKKALLDLSPAEVSERLGQLADILRVGELHEMHC
jgi:hypothetical protein